MLLLVASETGHVYTFATRKLQPMITSETGKALIQTCLNSPDSPPRSDPTTDQRMSATGFQETDLTYQVSESDSSGETKVCLGPPSEGKEGEGLGRQRGEGALSLPHQGQVVGAHRCGEEPGQDPSSWGTGVHPRSPDRRPAHSISGRPPCPYKAGSGSEPASRLQPARLAGPSHSSRQLSPLGVGAQLSPASRGPAHWRVGSSPRGFRGLGSRHGVQAGWLPGRRLPDQPVTYLLRMSAGHLREGIPGCWDAALVTPPPSFSR